jgi:purine-binding chemotaxis protein CheW
METVARTTASRFLTFRADTQLYALRSEEVTEVIRLPAMVRVPQGPRALLGIANLRGVVLPIAGLRELLEKRSAALTATARAIVLDVGLPVALVVDSVETLETTENSNIETRRTELSAEGGEKLVGTFSTARQKQVAKILDIKNLLEAAFSKRSREVHERRKTSAVAMSERSPASYRSAEMIVTFEVAGQEFALPLGAVQEILPMPETIAAVARTESIVLGVISFRETLLPLLSLRGLLGFAAVQSSDDREKIVVMNVSGTQVGLVADRARAIVSADVELIDPIPPVLAARTGGESRIRSIYRGEAGRRLISILSPEQLFREDVMQRLSAGSQSSKTQDGDDRADRTGELIFLVFRLGDDEFGLPIESVVEVAQVPVQITRVPKAPKFLEGVVNIRGEVLPVVDQRRRFEMPKLDKGAARRLVVIKTDRHRAGLIVDGVSDVLRIPATSVEPPPDLTDATSRLVRGIVNLERSNRIVLVLDPTELLTRAEQGQLDTFQAEGKKANA